MKKSSWIYTTMIHLSTLWSLFIWKTSLDIIKPKDICLKWYLLKCVLNVFRRVFMCKKYALESILPSDLKYVVEPDNYVHVGAF